MEVEGWVTSGDGRVVAGRYRLEREIGHGAMGVVWQATDLRLDRAVAVKQLRLADGLTAPEARQARQRALREARIVARLHHPNAVTVFDVVDDIDGLPALVMEYVPSHTLAMALTEGAVLPVGRVAELGAQIAAALAAAHAAGIVHRDVKPGNILLAADGSAKITDFGISRASGDVTVTRIGVVAGTPAYLAPEVARGEPAGPASDVFSLGATLYAAVEGHPPFGELDNPVAQLHRVAAGRAEPPRRAGPLTDVVNAALQDDPGRRPTMGQLAEALSAIDGRATVGPAEAPTVVVPAVAVPAATRVDLHPADFPETVPAHPVAAPRLSRRAGTALAAGVCAILVALLVMALVAGHDSSAAGNGVAATTSGRSSATSAATATTGRIDPADAQRAVTDYYRLLADDPDQAWTRLGPGLRTQDRDAFTKYWAAAEGLRVVSAPRTSGSTATVAIEYTRAGQGLVRENHQLGLVALDGSVLIDSDRVLDRRITPTAPKEPPHGGGHHGKGHGKGGGH